MNFENLLLLYISIVDYVEQDANFTWESRSGLENSKLNPKCTLIFLNIINTDIIIIILL